MLGLRQSPIKKALKELQPSPIINNDVLESLQAKKAEIESQLIKSFGCEVQSRRFLEIEIDKITSKIGAILDVKQTPALIKYPTLPIDILTWRTKKKLPLLVPFMLHEKTYTMSCVGGIVREAPILPDGMEKFYNDFYVHMRRKSENRRVTITAQFTGVIPNDARTAIQEAIKVFGTDKIVLLTEAKLKVNVERLTPPDPIAIAFKNNTLYYICDFDLTPVEKFALELSQSK